MQKMKLVFILFFGLFCVANAADLILQGRVRDFTPQTNPDFESFGCGVTTGMVEPILGADGTPTLVLPPKCVTSNNSFWQWYHDVPGVNIPLTIFLDLSNAGSSDPNVYTYNNQAFFPIDNEGFGNYENYGHNFHFTMHVHTVFTYHGTEVLNFQGDDDVWVFINNRLAVDIGGVHGPAPGSVNLPNAASQLGLTVGNDYNFDLFSAERHTTGSTILIQTSIEFQPPPTTGTTQNPTTGTTGATCVEDGTFRTQSEGDWGDSCTEGFATGCYRDDNFAQCFPTGLTVGCVCDKRTVVSCGYNLQFDSSTAIQNYLPQLGRPDVLTQSYYNPSNPPPISTSSGNFGGQLTALALSIGFSHCDSSFHTDCTALEDLYICDNRCEQCKKNSNSCSRNSKINCQFVSDREEFVIEGINVRNNNGEDGKPQYPNCEAFYGMQISQIFEAANKALGGCSSCGTSKREDLLSDRNNQNCVRNSGCRRNPELRNNDNCNRNSDCKRNNNCCCCVVQSSDPLCDPVVLNDCITLINQAFIFGKTLEDVDSGNLFMRTACPTTGSEDK